MERVRSWRAVQAEVVQPAQLPDGLIEARLAGERKPRPYVVEVGTYPERRLVRQLVRDTLLVYLDRDEMPETLAVILRPRGKLRVAETLAVPSEGGWSELRLRWRVVELWTVPAEHLLASGDPGLMPWAPLAQFTGSPRRVVERCREVIERVPNEAERANLLAVTHVFTRLRYNDPELLTILGGERIMIESPLLREIEERGEARGRARARVEDILTFLRERFGEVPEDIRARLSGIEDEATLRALVHGAARCTDLADFRSSIPD